MCYACTVQGAVNIALGRVQNFFKNVRADSGAAVKHNTVKLTYMGSFGVHIVRSH